MNTHTRALLFLGAVLFSLPLSAQTHSEVIVNAIATGIKPPVDTKDLAQRAEQVRSLKLDEQKFDKRFFTYSALNGRFWLNSNYEFKLGYSTGLFEGMLAVLAKEKISSNMADYLPPHLNSYEIERAIEAFYAQPANILIRVTDAVRFVSKEMAGVPRALIDDDLQAARWVADNAPERKP